MKTNQPISQEEFELLESYVMNRLTSVERNHLENRLKEEIDLSEKLEEVRTLIQGVEEAVLKEKLDEFHLEENSVQKHIQKNTTPYWWLVAASVILLVGVLLWVNSTQIDDGKDLFYAYFDQDPGLPSAMSNTSTYTFDRGMVDFKTGDYRAAIEQWRPLLDEKPANDTLNYFMGMAHLGLGEPSEGILFLDRLKGRDDSYFGQEALWYKALALIHLNEFDQAIDLLQNADHPKRQELIDQLKEK